MREEDLNWYRKEFKRYPFKHQTTDSKRTFLCFTNFEKEEVGTFDTHLFEQFLFCPLCGKKLGRRIKKESGHKIVWEN